jgi:biopolymer transport protein ExbB/TolQ
MIWVYLGCSAVFLLVCYAIYRAGGKAKENEELGRVNKDLNKDIDALAEAAHKQEKREEAHAKRVADIMRAHNISIDRVRELLNAYAPESEAARASKP